MRATLYLTRGRPGLRRHPGPVKLGLTLSDATSAAEAADRLEKAGPDEEEVRVLRVDRPRLEREVDPIDRERPRPTVTTYLVAIDHLRLTACFFRQVDSSSRSAFASLESAVSKPSVNQP
jgi:hypothetical protein